MSEQELHGYVQAIPKLAASQGLTTDQYLRHQTKVMNEGAMGKAFPPTGEARAEMILNAVGLERAPRLSAQATLFDYLNHFDEGNRVGGRLPPPRRPWRTRWRSGPARG
jgi:hypothetical protein